jgi:hypothetical protein
MPTQGQNPPPGPQPYGLPPPQPQQWGQPGPPPQIVPAPAPQPAGQPLVYRLHSGARSAMNISGVLLCLLVVTIPIAIIIFWKTAAARLEIAGDELIFRNLISKRWRISSLRRLGVLAVPVIARGIGGALARKKVGGAHAIHLCAIDDRGKKMNMLISIFERHQEIVQQVAAMTRLNVEEVKSGAFGPKWQE